jgi:hypothetical protein
MSTLTYWGTAASTAVTLQIPGTTEIATQRNHADRSVDQHGKCKSRWIPYQSEYVERRSKWKDEERRKEMGSGGHK